MVSVCFPAQCFLNVFDQLMKNQQDDMLTLIETSDYHFWRNGIYQAAADPEARPNGDLGYYVTIHSDTEEFARHSRPLVKGSQ